MHMNCPPGKDSCFYQRALVKGEKPAPHKFNIGTPINPDYLTKIFPIHQRLASDSLLKGCARCLTLNSNKGLHSVIWKIQKAANLDLGEEAVKIAATRDYKRKKERNCQTGCDGALNTGKVLPRNRSELTTFLRCRDYGDDFVQRIVAEYKTWCYHSSHQHATETSQLTYAIKIRSSAGRRKGSSEIVHMALGSLSIVWPQIRDDTLTERHNGHRSAPLGDN
ncbi:hypothetical protein TNCV_4181221 [Trichonephila clavipes]|nr:hypothetical protein TNCV_4181221 [Trichonephila clavipes]